MKKTTIALLVVTSMLTACAVQHTDSATGPEEVSGGLFGLSKADNIAVDNESAFKGKNQVYLGGFHVAFLEEKKASNKAGGGLTGSGFGGKSSANIDLKGITPEHMQAITEAAFLDFTKKMTDAGYIFADRNVLLTSDDFKSVAGEASPKREESSFFGGGVTQTIVAPAALGKIYAMDSGFAFSNPMVAANNFSNKHDNIPVIFASYTVDFANKAGGHGGYFSMSSSLEVGQGISVAPGGGVQWLGGGGGTFDNRMGSVKLGQPVGTGETFGTMTNTTSEAEVGLEAAVNVIGLLGGIGSNQSRSFEIVADPQKYATVTGKALSDANTSIVTTMQKLR